MAHTAATILALAFVALGSTLASGLEVETRTLPADGFLLKIAFFVDGSLPMKLGGGSNLDDYTDSIVDKLEDHLQHPSLTTQFVLEKVEEVYRVDRDVQPTMEELDRLGNELWLNERADANVYIVLTGEEGDQNVGLEGTICSGDRKKRTSIVRHLDGEDDTAKNIAHAIGRNLGMKNDWYGRCYRSYYVGGQKYRCGPRTFMHFNYAQDAEKWSQCSVNDFDAYYEANQPFCLDGPSK